MRSSDRWKWHSSSCSDCSLELGKGILLSARRKDTTSPAEAESKWRERMPHAYDEKRNRGLCRWPLKFPVLEYQSTESSTNREKLRKLVRLIGQSCRRTHCSFVLLRSSITESISIVAISCLLLGVGGRKRLEQVRNCWPPPGPVSGGVVWFAHVSDPLVDYVGLLSYELTKIVN